MAAQAVSDGVGRRGQIQKIGEWKKERKERKEKKKRRRKKKNKEREETGGYTGGRSTGEASEVVKSGQISPEREFGGRK